MKTPEHGTEVQTDKAAAVSRSLTTLRCQPNFDLVILTTTLYVNVSEMLQIIVLCSDHGQICYLQNCTDIVNN